MIAEGQIVLFRFPQTDLTGGKYRPALVLRQLPGRYRDWLICMISSQLDQKIGDIDEIVDQTAPDFLQSGLKLPSVIRTTRLAVASESILLGRLGQIGPERLTIIRQKLADWLRPVL
jgi:mRNA interferase MazF